MRPPLPFFPVVCVSAEAATLLTGLGVRGFETSLAAQMKSEE